MEFPNLNDFFLNFKAIYNEKDEFIDYILLDLSDNFTRIFGIKSENLIGKKVSEIILLYPDTIIGLKDIYYNMIPNTRRKFELYFKEIDKWYFVNIFSDQKDYLLVFYTEITKLKKEITKYELSNSRNNYFNNLYYMDKLTGLYNKDFFEIELNRLDTKRQLPISIIFGDLNGLKLINDGFGHKMGDLAIKESANIIKRAVRKEDIISRFGGDEFLVLLPNTSEDTANTIIDRIKYDCSKNTVECIKLSISFGAATKTKEDEDIFSIVKKAEDRMYYKKLTESKEAKLDMINYLRNKLEALSIETKIHYDKLKKLSLLLADAMGLSDIEKEEIRLLCEFHDIGKIAISPNILHKKEKLTDEEWEQIKRHSEIGYHIVGSARETLAIDELILMHHERWDGKGYPGLIKEDEIPITVRVFAIADAYEAMISDRPYKEKMQKSEALNEIRKKSGTQFDPHIAEVFIKLMEDEKLAI